MGQYILSYPTNSEFYSCNFDLDHMTLIVKFHIDNVKTYPYITNKFLVSKRS